MLRLKAVTHRNEITLTSRRKFPVNLYSDLASTIKFTANAHQRDTAGERAKVAETVRRANSSGLLRSCMAFHKYFKSPMKRSISAFSEKSGMRHLTGGFSMYRSHIPRRKWLKLAVILEL